jgi:hypothetical protein
MDNASKNAGEMIGRLQMQYNRGRQANITNELVDIITGASGTCFLNCQCNVRLIALGYFSALDGVSFALVLEGAPRAAKYTRRHAQPPVQSKLTLNKIYIPRW